MNVKDQILILQDAISSLSHFSADISVKVETKKSTKTPNIAYDMYNLPFGGVFFDDDDDDDDDDEDTLRKITIKTEGDEDDPDFIVVTLHV